MRLKSKRSSAPQIKRILGATQSIDHMRKDRDKELKRCKNYCLRLISLRPRTEYELKSRMEEKGYADEVITGIVGVLKEEGLVNDLKFAGDWIDSRLRTNPRGVKGLKDELTKKGVSKEVIEEAMSQREEGLDERAIALELLKDMLQGESGQPDNKMKARLYSFLLRRGFDAEVAEEAVNEALGE